MFLSQAWTVWGSQGNSTPGTCFRFLQGESQAADQVHSHLAANYRSQSRLLIKMCIWDPTDHSKNICYCFCFHCKIDYFEAKCLVGSEKNVSTQLKYAHRKTTILGNVRLMHHLPRNYPSFKFTCSLQLLSEDNLFDQLKCYEDSQVHNIVLCYYNSHSCGPLPHNNSG